MKWESNCKWFKSQSDEADVDFKSHMQVSEQEWKKKLFDYSNDILNDDDLLKFEMEMKLS